MLPPLQRAPKRSKALTRLEVIAEREILGTQLIKRSNELKDLFDENHGFFRSFS